MSKIATEAGTIWRAPAAADASDRRSRLRRFGLHRAHVAFLRFLEALVPPRALPPSPPDKTDWPRFPAF
jgi:hypothetical protein